MPNDLSPSPLEDELHHLFFGVGRPAFERPGPLRRQKRAVLLEHEEVRLEFGRCISPMRRPAAESSIRILSRRARVSGRFALITHQVTTPR
jgi:hypothetical protein